MSFTSSLGLASRADGGHPGLPFIMELKAKEFAHLQVTNASTHFSWWLFNLKSQVFQTHPDYDFVMT